MKKQYIAPAIQQSGVIPEIEITLKISNATGKFTGGDIEDDSFFDDDDGPKANESDWDDEETLSWFDY